MQITKKSSKKVFEPIEISIRIESQEEYDALYNMSLRNVRIPSMMGKVNGGIIKNFLDSLNENLK